MNRNARTWVYMGCTATVALTTMLLSPAAFADHGVSERQFASQSPHPKCDRDNWGDTYRYERETYVCKGGGEGWVHRKF